MLTTAFYTGVLALVVATSLWSVRRTRRPAAGCLGTGAIIVAAVLLAAASVDDDFRGMRLLCYGLFGFVAFFWAACAWLLGRAHRRWAAGFVAGFVLLESAAIDGFWLEPHWLEVSRVRLVSDKITKPVKIALLADLQTDEFGNYERSVIERIVAEQPDLILLAGDYIQEWDYDRHLSLQAELAALLKESGFAAPLGAYAVRGNVDGGGWTDSFDDTCVTAVRRTSSFRTGELLVTCLSMRDSFSTDLAVPADDRFQIVLGHCPNFALGDVPADLLVAGHCHGGQVRLPGIGPLVTHARVPRAWSAGVTQLDGDRTLIVSRGVGMERGQAPRLRFLCRPELVFIELSPR